MLLVLLLLSVCSALEAQASKRLLRNYHCQIKLLTVDRAHVRVVIGVEGVSAADLLPVRLVQFDREQLRDLQVRNGREAIAGLKILRNHRIETLEIPTGELQRTGGSSVACELDYVAESSTELGRIPLPVPDLPTPFGERVVRISVEIGKGLVATRDSFPALTWSAGHAETDLASVPSFVKIGALPGNSVSWLRRLSSPTNLNDITVLTILLGASFLWWLRSRKHASR